MSAIDLAALRAEIRGRVIGPGDHGYDDARTVMYGGIDRRLAVILNQNIPPADAAAASG